MSLAIEAGSRRCWNAACGSFFAVAASLTAASTAPLRGSSRTIEPRAVQQGYVGSAAANDSLDATPMAAYRPMLVAEP
jgi:hypothetical protein